MSTRKGQLAAPAAETRWWPLPRPLAGVLAGLLSLCALLAMSAAMRGLLGVRTLPDTLAEGATFYLPMSFFEYMIQTFRGQAKVFLIAGIFGFLALAGALVGLLYARWPRPRLAVLLAVALWAFTMLVALPASGEGFFGMEFSDPLPVIAAYAAGWAAFSMVLAAAFWLFAGEAARHEVPPAKETRR